MQPWLCKSFEWQQKPLWGLQKSRWFMQQALKLQLGVWTSKPTRLASLILELLCTGCTPHPLTPEYCLASPSTANFAGGVYTLGPQSPGLVLWHPKSNSLYKKIKYSIHRMELYVSVILRKMIYRPKKAFQNSGLFPLGRMEMCLHI